MKRSSALALLALCLLALALRLIAIDSRGLWGDEAWRVWAARQAGFLDVLHTVWAQPPSAPLYWLGLHAWVVLFGHGDMAVRLLSVPAAVGVVPAAYWLGTRIAGAGAGLVAAGLTAVSPLAVEVGQEATMYAWTMLFATLALAAGLRLLQTGRGALLYVALGTLLLYTHYMGALLLGLLFVAVSFQPSAVSRRRNNSKPVVTPHSALRTPHLGGGSSGDGGTLAAVGCGDGGADGGAVGRAVSDPPLGGAAGTVWVGGHTRHIGERAGRVVPTEVGGSGAGRRRAACVRARPQPRP